MAAGSIVVELIAKTGSFSTDTGRAEKSLNRLKKEAADVTGVFKNLVGIAIGGAGIAGVINLTDQYQKFTAQLKLAASSSEDFAASYENVQRIANEAQADIGATATLYARLSNSLKDAGVSQQEVADISETVALALRVNGASAAEAASAMLQLSQAFGAGRLAGEEFRAVSESAPGLLRQLSKELGVAYGELKQMAADGKITSEVLRQAFTNQEYLEGLRQQSQEIQTVSGAMTVLRNNLTLMFGETNQTTGATKTLSDTIIILANNLDFAASAVSVVLQTILVLGANVKFVFQGIGRDIGGMAAQLVALATLDFKGFSFIGDQLKKDAKEARAELDKFEKDILNPKAAKFTPVPSTSGPSGNVASAKSIAAPLIAAAKQAKVAQAEYSESAREMALAQKTLLEEGQSLTLTLRDPLQVLNDEYKKLDALLKAGAISQEVFNKAVTNAQSAYDDTLATTKAYREEQEKLNGLLAATPTAQLEKLREDMIALGKAFDDGVISEEQFLEAVQTRLGRLPEDVQAATNEMSEFSKQAARNMQDAFADFLFDPFQEGLDGLLKSFITTLQKMTSQALASQVFKMLGSGTGGFLDNILGGSFAAGGNPPVGKVSLVGERGPELFVPNTAGTIIPNHAMGGGNTNVTVNVDAGGSSVDGNGGAQLGQMIGAAVQSILIKEKRAGGLLA